MGEKKHNSVEDILNRTEHVLDQQYLRKTQMETKAGFILALWGIITMSFIEKVDKNGFSISIISTLHIIIALVDLIMLLIVIWSSEYNQIDIGKNKYYKLASSSKGSRYYRRLWEKISYVIDDNDKVIGRKNKILNISIVLSALYILTTFLYCVFV